MLLKPHDKYSRLRCDRWGMRSSFYTFKRPQFCTYTYRASDDPCLLKQAGTDCAVKNPYTFVSRCLRDASAPAKLRP